MLTETPAARLARVALLAEQVWEDWANASEFLTSRQPVLGNYTPVEMMATPEGAARVERILMGLEHSLPV